MNENALKLGLVVLSLNGAYRGVMKYRRNLSSHRELIESKKFYLEKVTFKLFSLPGYIILGVAANVFLAPWSIVRSIKRLEVEIRGMEDEKGKKWYNDII